MAGELLTNDGRVLVLGDPRIGRCVGCGLSADPKLVLPLTIGKDPLEVCGGCLAEGLAILLGRRHVQQGGNIDDLHQPT